jgi:hypothetical protein
VTRPEKKRLLSLVIDENVSMARPVASPESTGGKDNYRLAVLPNLAGKFIHLIRRAIEFVSMATLRQ